MNGLVERHRISLVLARREGPYLGDLDPRIEVSDLGNRSTTASIVPLSGWLKREKPDVLLSHLTHVNVAASLANRLAGGRRPHVAVEHNQMGLNYARITRKGVKIAYRAVRYVYPGISRVVSVSEGVASSVKGFSGLAGTNFQTIHNPVVTPRLLAQASEPTNQPWLLDKPVPTLLGCGRLVEQKDFENLLHALAHVRKVRPVRLVILGEGERRGALEALRDELGLTDCVAMPGFDRNPFAAMRAADLFVLSSRWEGLPTVLIEALATGVNVVSTDCPSGPDEVLDHGKYGPLVPVGDSQALAAAILGALDRPQSAETLRARAMDYSLERAVAQYEALFASLVATRR